MMVELPSPATWSDIWILIQENGSHHAPQQVVMPPQKDLSQVICINLKSPQSTKKVNLSLASPEIPS